MDVQMRHQMIMQALRQRSPVLVGELAAALDCSEMTVRRDLESLERSGGLRRVHGGAASVFLSAEETPYGIRALESQRSQGDDRRSCRQPPGRRGDGHPRRWDHRHGGGTSTPQPADDRHATRSPASLRAARVPGHQAPPPRWRGPSGRAVVDGKSHRDRPFRSSGSTRA